MNRLFFLLFFWINLFFKYIVQLLETSFCALYPHIVPGFCFLFTVISSNNNPLPTPKLFVLNRRFVIPIPIVNSASVNVIAIDGIFLQFSFIARALIHKSKKLTCKIKHCYPPSNRPRSTDREERHLPSTSGTFLRQFQFRSKQMCFEALCFFVL